MHDSCGGTRSVDCRGRRSGGRRRMLRFAIGPHTSGAFAAPVMATGRVRPIYCVKASSIRVWLVGLGVQRAAL
jgi:hypothetical protein